MLVKYGILHVAIDDHDMLHVAVNCHMHSDALRIINKITVQPV